MKAAQINEYGSSEIITVNEISIPIPNKGQVLIEVFAASINPFDVKFQQGLHKEKIPMQFPFTIGGDFSGIIKESGDDVNDFKKGQEVYGHALIISGGSGAFAEYTAVNISNIGLKPKKINYIEAASLPLVGSSVVQAVEEHIMLKQGQKILIHGGAGGIGSLVIQLAKYLGAYVATTVSNDDKEFVKRLGADMIIDYRSEDFSKMLKEYDAVYDTVGGETAKKSFLVLKKDGVLVSMRGKPDENLAKQYQVTAIGQSTKTNTAYLNRLSELIETEAIKAQVDKIFSLMNVREAFEYQEEMHPRGKVVIQIK